MSLWFRSLTSSFAYRCVCRSSHSFHVYVPSSNHVQEGPHGPPASTQNLWPHGLSAQRVYCWEPTEVQSGVFGWAVLQKAASSNTGGQEVSPFQTGTALVYIIHLWKNTRRQQSTQASHYLARWLLAIAAVCQSAKPTWILSCSMNGTVCSSASPQLSADMESMSEA